MQSGHRQVFVVERLLVSTALEQSWNDTEPILFLGEWCRLHSRRDRWSKLDAIVLPYHWDENEKLLSDCEFLASLYEELLVEVADELNVLHGTDKSRRYWRILLGPWLSFFIQTLFDRWSSIQQAIRTHEVSRTIILSGCEDTNTPGNMEDFLHLGNSLNWNHYLYGRILKDFTDIPCSIRTPEGIDYLSSSGSLTHDRNSPRVLESKLRLANIFSKCSSRLTKSTDYLIINTGLRSLQDELVLQLRLGQIPRLITVEPPVAVAIDNTYRCWTLDASEQTGFAFCVRRLIPEQMPTIYLEGYQRLCDEPSRRRWPRSPKAIFTGASHYYDDVFKAWCAERTEEGAPLVIAQHGGHVGTAWSFTHDHEMAIADRFLSWGWTDPAESKVVPVGMLKAPTLPGGDGNKRHRALLVTSNTGLQSSSIGSHMLSSQYLGYLEDQFAFVEALSPVVRDALMVRLSVEESGWEFEHRWRDRCPSMTLETGQRQIMDLVAEARVVISTTNGTTFLETIFVDVPTVVYWNTSRWAVLESARPYIEALKTVGIFHDDVESAAMHLSRIWGDVEGWWSNGAVIDAVASFKRRYCSDPGDVHDTLRTVLRCVAGDGPPTN